MYERLMRRGEESNAKVVFRLGHGYFRLDRLNEALPVLRRAVELQPNNAAWNYRLGFVLERQKSFGDALHYYRKALDLSPEQTAWVRRVEACEAAIAQLRLDVVVKNKAATWQMMSTLEDGLATHSGDCRWLERLADAYFKMGKFESAAVTYAKASALSPKSGVLPFKAGWAWHLAGRPDKADEAYVLAVAKDTELGAATVGIGAYFQARGQWKLAADSYAKTLISNPESVEIRYRLGLALQKIYDWDTAARVFQEGLELDPFQERMSWRLGLSYERLGDLKNAERAYSRILESSASASLYWKYRLGYVLQLQGRYEEACLAFYLSREDRVSPTPSTSGNPYLEDVLEADLQVGLLSQSADLCYKLGVRAEQLGYFAIAATAYGEAVKRTTAYEPERFFRLGRSLMLEGKYREASAAFMEIRQFKRPHAVDTTQYMKKRHLKQAMVYTEYMETLTIQGSTVLYESGHGSAIAGSPLQLCKSIITDQRFTGFTHVWVVNDPKNIPAEFRRRADFVFVVRDSDLYLRYLATARYLINDNTYPPYFIRRDEQQYLNTWHGTPLKTLGRDIKGGVLEHKNAARNFLHATHLIAPNQFTADCLIEKYDVAGIFSGKLALTGYPRVDATLTPSDAQRTALREKLGIPAGKKVVLYAPTWRGTLGDRSLDNERLIADVEAMGGSEEWHLLYRGHAMTSSQAKGKLLDRHAVPAAIDTNDLLAIVDVLITDYSSIFFDFIPTGRPIIYYAYDLDRYKEERGLYFDLESMPGSVCHDIDTVVEQLNSLVPSGTPAHHRQEYAAAQREFCPHDDGHAAARVVEFFFFGDAACEVHNGMDEKRNILLFQGSFLPNGITTSYLNLVSHIDSGENNVYVVVDPEALASEPARLEKFDQNPDHVRVLARVGSHVLTPEERWVVDKFNSQYSVDSEEMWAIIDRAFAREFRRMFGASAFDSVICFEGYARFWTALLGNAPLKDAKKSVYLHNDMNKEWQNRFPYLEGNFRLYKRFDSLISVTESVAEENVSQLAERFDLNPNSFTFCNNLVNPQGTLRLAEDPLDADIAEWLNNGDTLFVTLGRLSPEKGHAKLIAAFSALAAEQPQAKLVILGDGPLLGSLQELITRLGLDGRVLLAGRRLNPFAILKSADCFVFSSDYEGQGLVVLEALILDRPVISTDVVGPRSVLEDGYGLLVENSEEGLADGFRKFFTGQIPHRKLDYELYQKEALDKFAAVAL
ncbi:CDP-glycerol glycerophosphotransferase family protein [Arthrobacter sp. zg-Y1219]|uniref:CDP-glycerol glycerophosphotransferase family protein n=1 Tax=Arthrobacter sp. zg-Y1219 TaxID=3049067 RepID=UPI0024C2D200|nr:CDP-glycerol glycerophosphotransferase family protein [Arthrobacter sp. zg-Y1219]MDK1359317.1 CDP-glycerol glycerophosphotransferase family protein [Arthrobacter sp. zg-Y1219]